MKYWYVNIGIQVGELEFSSKSVHKTTAKEEDFDGDAYAKDFYGFPDDPDNNDGSYYFDCGNQCVELYECKEITKQDYIVLSRYP